MRGIAVFMLSLAMVSGADASSIITLSGKQATDPSIVRLGDAQGAVSSIATAGATEPGATASPSLIVLGDSAVNAGKVAAIPAGKPRAGNVLVIRAGVVGGSSIAPAAVATAAAGGNDTRDGKAPTLRDAMTQAGQAPAIAQ